MKTDILVSFSDNSSIFSFLSIIDPNLTTMAFQNGQRFSFERSYKIHLKKNIPIIYDIYFSHGKIVLISLKILLEKMIFL